MKILGWIFEGWGPRDSKLAWAGVAAFALVVTTALMLNEWLEVFFR